MSELHLTPEHLATILAELSTGDSIPKIMARCGIPVAVLWRYLGENSEAARLYDMAQRNKAQLLMEQVLDIADGPGKDFEKRLRIDTRLKVAAKYAPALFGDIQKPGNGVTINLNLESLSDEELQRKTQALQSRLLQAGSVVAIQ